MRTAAWRALPVIEGGTPLCHHGELPFLIFLSAVFSTAEDDTTDDQEIKLPWELQPQSQVSVSRDPLHPHTVHNPCQLWLYRCVSGGALLTESMAEVIAGNHKVSIFSLLNSFYHFRNKGSEPFLGSHFNPHPVISNPLPSISMTSGQLTFTSNTRQFSLCRPGWQHPVIVYLFSLLVLLQIWDQQLKKVLNPPDLDSYMVNVSRTWKSLLVPLLVTIWWHKWLLFLWSSSELAWPTVSHWAVQQHVSQIRSGMRASTHQQGPWQEPHLPTPVLHLGPISLCLLSSWFLLMTHSLRPHLLHWWYYSTLKTQTN